MAVKQYANENNQQADNLKKYNINKILEYIGELENSLVNDSNEHDLLIICKEIVDLLGRVDVPDKREMVMPFGEQIKKVDSFLEFLLKNDSNKKMIHTCLELLYTIILSVDNPSAAAGIVLHHYPPAKGTKWFVSTPSKTSDEDLKRSVKTLCKWLSCSYFVHDLDQWIIGILTEIREQHKFNLLMEIAHENIFMLFKYVTIPIIYPSAISVFVHILVSVQHTPDIFKGLIGPICRFYTSFKHQVDVSQLTDTVAALMWFFPLGMASYADLMTVLPPPLPDFKSRLDVPTWHIRTTKMMQKQNARVGLVNLGNTCYMNSVLQALVMTKLFVRDVLLTENRSPLFQSMQKLLALLVHADRRQLLPTAVLKAARPPGFNPGHEQDSSEFLDHLLDRLHEQEMRIVQTVTNRPVDDAMNIDADGDLPSTLKVMETNETMAATSSSTGIQAEAVKTLIEKSFGGNISITHKCLNCNSESKQCDSFRNLHLSFPDVGGTAVINHTVQDMLDFYCSTETLDLDNKYYCEQCERLCDGERLINIVSAPQYLILTLKHFKYDQKYNLRAKLLHKVWHEEIVSIKIMPNNTEGMEYEQNYQLYAAVVHSGVSMESGHYFTYASDPCGWYKFDDSFVEKSTITELQNLQPPHTPYILFYKMAPDTRAAIDGGPSNGNGRHNNIIIVDPKSMEYPAMHELPPLLSEHVRVDNVAYASEMHSSMTTIRTLNGSYRSDDNDEPPSSCGSHFAPSFNRFIS